MEPIRSFRPKQRPFQRKITCILTVVEMLISRSIYLSAGDNVSGQLDYSEIALADGLFEFVITHTH